VSALNHSRACRHGSASEALDAKQIEADGGAGNVGDAVEGADFMEVNFFDGKTVNRRFRLGQPAEDAQG
jgi:hypothetical protein